MCGICGYIGDLDPSIISHMTKTLRLRGPDDSGIEFFRNDMVAFGHCRLAIIDLTEAAHQPMFNRDRTICITYNGEIYNYLELRKELEKSGYQFRSQSDTEVIIACYERYGKEMVSRLNGIFSFAIYDVRDRTIHIARDHVGVKPLYYALSNGIFLFASEIKAILAANVLKPEINSQALWDYLTYLYVPCPLTMYQGILQVPPAHVLTLDLKTKGVSLNRYWDPLNGADTPLDNIEEAARLVRYELTKSVKEQLVGDVPLGALLSGGIDSNVIVGLMANHSTSRIRTFTAIFSDQNASFFNERAGAARVAKKFNTIHEEIEIPTPSMEDIMSMLSWTDQPFGNPTLFLSYLICKEIREKVTVALSGAGGDELFGGYIRYKYFNLARRVVEASPVRLNFFAHPLMKIWPYKIKPEMRKRAYKFVRGLVSSKAQQYLRMTYFLDESQKLKVLPMGKKCLTSERIIESLFHEGAQLKNDLNVLQYVDIMSYLRDDILEYTDKSSMATSLEVRVPFLSPRIIQMSFRIPDKFKIDRGKTKLVLKKAFEEFFPRENLRAPKKDFSAPLRIWINDMEKYFDEIQPRLPDDCPLNLEMIDQMRNEHRRGINDYGLVLFGLLMLEVWMVNTVYK